MVPDRSRESVFGSPGRCRAHAPRRLVVPLVWLVIATAVAGCNLTGAGRVWPRGRIRVVAAENQYGNVAQQVGGRYVSVASIMSNPSIDPHEYEVSPSVAAAVSVAQVVIQNGIGYDGFMVKLEAASPSPSRHVVDVQQLLHLPGSTPNPHLWYDPATMPKVAEALARDFARVEPQHAAYFRRRASAFLASLRPLSASIASFRSTLRGTPVAATEPVADYLLRALGMRDLTPFRLQADIMNGLDPAPQDLAAQEGLFSAHRVKVLVYNEQVADPLTQSFISDAQHAGIPVVGVYETMPVPGYSYQSWMLAEVHALRRAVVDARSTPPL